MRTGKIPSDAKYRMDEKLHILLIFEIWIVLQTVKILRVC